MLAIAAATGLIAVLGGLVAHLRSSWRVEPPATAAALAVVVVDVASLVVGGSFWQDYLIPVVPAAALCTALTMFW